VSHRLDNIASYGHGKPSRALILALRDSKAIALWPLYLVVLLLFNLPLVLRMECGSDRVATVLRRHACQSQPQGSNSLYPLAGHHDVTDPTIPPLREKIAGYLSELPIARKDKILIDRGDLA
jgi:hypothetical protein